MTVPGVVVGPIVAALTAADKRETAAFVDVLTTLLDNQWIMMERALGRLMPPGQALPLGWFHRDILLSADERERLAAQMPSPGVSREDLKEKFWNVVSLLCEARDRETEPMPDLYRRARVEVLERAIQAVTATGEVVPTVQRIIFFTLPLARRGILSGTILAWARALGEFGATLMVAGATRFKTATLPISVYLNISSGELGLALACSWLLLFSGFLLLLSLKWIGRGRSRNVPFGSP